MHKRLISFSKPAFEWLRDESRRLGISVSELVRRAVDEYQFIKELDRSAREDLAKVREKKRQP